MFAKQIERMEKSVRGAKRALARKHLGPGNHPDGSSQKVHGGGKGGAGTRNQSRYDSRYHDGDDVEPGDYVDFGAYGKLYVVKTNADIGTRKRWWVTDEETERHNPDAAGWFISPEDAKGFAG